MSRKKPIYCVFKCFSAALKKTNPKQSLSQEAIDEISKNNAVWLYPVNFMLIIEPQ